MRLLVLALPLACGCAITFDKALTPSGEPCVDLPIFPAGQPVDRPYHRIRPIASSVKCGTEAERLESLRREACASGGDAVIEAANEEYRLPDHSYVVRASGTAVQWRRAPTRPQPIPTLNTRPPAGPSEATPPQSTTAPRPPTILPAR